MEIVMFLILGVIFILTIMTISSPSISDQPGTPDIDGNFLILLEHDRNYKNNSKVNALHNDALKAIQQNNDDEGFRIYHDEISKEIEDSIIVELNTAKLGLNLLEKYKYDDKIERKKVIAGILDNVSRFLIYAREKEQSRYSLLFSDLDNHFQKALDRLKQL